MINAKQIQAVLDHLDHQRRVIFGGEPTVVFMVCEHGVHAHMATGERLAKISPSPLGHTPTTHRLVTCPIKGHLSSHFFSRDNSLGRVSPGPCCMHPLGPDVRIKNQTVAEALDAAARVGGPEALAAALCRYVRFDPLLWRLWDMTVHHQRGPAPQEYKHAR